MSGNNTWAGNVILQSSSTVNAVATTQLIIAGTVQDNAQTTTNFIPTSPPPNLTKAGQGAINLAPVSQTLTLLDQPTLTSVAPVAGTGMLTAGTTYYYVVTALSAAGDDVRVCAIDAWQRPGSSGELGASSVLSQSVTLRGMAVNVRRRRSSPRVAG